MARELASRVNNSPLDTGDEETESQHKGLPDARSGQDERRRGWFWHWNGIVTQYTPLIGLKGIGLLNSYTVWTDRREDSPHRGYAFPSQQSEANFYGEDRSELITINKILVALDLIEIRKEMVRKTDEQGRRWKVPQNLYRVKDRQDGLDLTVADVLRVVELADRDKAVYRYIRKVFSSRFEPIDRNNVWHSILTEIADHPTWQKLAERVARQEAKASARTRAGHRARAKRQEARTGDLAQPGLSQNSENGDQGDQAGTPRRREAQPAEMTSGHDKPSPLPQAEQALADSAHGEVVVAPANSGLAIAVGRSNNGFRLADDRASNGSNGNEGGSVADSNEGCESSVEPGNTMYYQSPSTTTTTTTSPVGHDRKAGPDVNGSREADNEPDRQQYEGRDQGGSQRAKQGSSPEAQRRNNGRDGAPGFRPAEQGLAGASGGGPLADPSPLVLSLYEAANDRPATRLERILLSELEADAAVAAEAVGSSGPEWVAEALREAVGSGSAFVAPKRIREIVTRWGRANAGPRRGHRGDNQDDTPRREESAKQAREGQRGETGSADVLRVSRSDAAQGDRLWGLVLDMLAVGDAANDLFRLRGVVPLGERADGAFVLGASTRTALRLLEGAYRPAVEQALSSLLPSSVTIDVLGPDRWAIEK